MKTARLYTSILLVSAVMLLSACGSSDKSEDAPAPAVSGSSATVGQQLLDLNEAREAGAITDEEYEAEKKKLLGDE